MTEQDKSPHPPAPRARVAGIAVPSPVGTHPQQEKETGGRQPSFHRLSASRCDSAAIRTQDPRLRRALLYPAELRNQPPYCGAKVCFFSECCKFSQDFFAAALPCRFRRALSAGSSEPYLRLRQIAICGFVSLPESTMLEPVRARCSSRFERGAQAGSSAVLKLVRARCSLVCAVSPHKKRRSPCGDSSKKA